MAVKLRVLFHDTPHSVSLLKQLGVKDSFKYVNTADPIHPDNLYPSWGLIIAHLQTKQNGSNIAEYEAPLDNIPPYKLGRYLGFDDWWSNTIMKDIKGNEFSRQDLVMLLANKEGGADVDPMPDKKYNEITEEHTLLGVAQFPEDSARSLDGRPLEESVRQIVYEALKTFDEQPDVFARL
jgi:hypothetical protein